MITDREFIERYTKHNSNVDNFNILLWVSIPRGGLILIPIIAIVSLFVYPFFYIQKRKILSDKGVTAKQGKVIFEYTYLFSWIQKLYRMNPKAKPSQIELLKKAPIFDDYIINEYIYNKNYNEDELRLFEQYSKIMDLSKNVGAPS